MAATVPAVLGLTGARGTGASSFHRSWFSHVAGWGMYAPPSFVHEAHDFWLSTAAMSTSSETLSLAFIKLTFAVPFAFLLG